MKGIFNNDKIVTIEREKKIVFDSIDALDKEYLELSRGISNLNDKIKGANAKISKDDMIINIKATYDMKLLDDDYKKDNGIHVNDSDQFIRTNEFEGLICN